MQEGDDREREDTGDDTIRERGRRGGQGIRIGKVLKGLGIWSLHARDAGGDGGEGCEGRRFRRGDQGSHTH